MGRLGFDALEMGRRHEDDEGEGAFEEFDYDAVFAFDGFDAADTTLEGTFDYEDLTGVFEVLEFLGGEEADIISILLK